MEKIRYGKDYRLDREFPVPTTKKFTITQEELDAKKEEFFARGGRVEKMGSGHMSAQINPIKSNDTRYLIDSIRSEVDPNLSASRRHLRTSLYGD